MSPWRPRHAVDRSSTASSAGVSAMGRNSIAGEGDRIGLTQPQIIEAELHQAAMRQAALDEQELKELEHAEYYPDQPLAAPPRRRSLLDRILRRG